MKYLLSHLYKLALADQQVTINLSESMVLPPLAAKEPQPWTDVELAKIWQAYEAVDRIAPCLLLMIYNGMIPGELFGLRADMIDMDKHLIIGAGLKTATRKAIPIAIADIIVPVVEHILTLTKGADDRRVLFTDKWAFYDLYKEFKTRNSIRDLPLYACRHITATALAVGTDVAPAIIQRIMRHAQHSTPQHYIHPDMTDALAGVNKLSKPGK